MRLEEPIQLASGEWSREYIDGKACLGRGADLKLACQALIELVSDIEFDSVGGLTMGADMFAHGVSILLPDKKWFSVRKKEKDHGITDRIAGAKPGPGDRVLLVDDVVTTGGSIGQALSEAKRTRATIVCAVTLVDRGDVASGMFEAEAIPYRPLVTYRDLDIAPVGNAQSRRATG